MLIQREASAGAPESADVLVTVRPADAFDIRVTSVVQAQFGAAIMQSVREVLTQLAVSPCEVVIDDHGALDWILRARLEAALLRAKGAPV